MRVHPLVVLLVAAGVMGVVERDEMLKLWIEINLGDPARQTALSRCHFEDHNFNRFSAAARTNCYQKWIQPASLALEVDQSLRTPNAVDLAHAVGEATASQMPTGDIREQQATKLFIHTMRQ